MVGALGWLWGLGIVRRPCGEASGNFAVTVFCAQMERCGALKAEGPSIVVCSLSGSNREYWVNNGVVG